MSWNKDLLERDGIDLILFALEYRDEVLRTEFQCKVFFKVWCSDRHYKARDNAESNAINRMVDAGVLCKSLESGYYRNQKTVEVYKKIMQFANVEQSKHKDASSHAPVF